MGCAARWCLGLLPAVIASFAFMTSFLASFWCQTVQFVPLEDAAADATPLQFGPWYQNEIVKETTTVGGTPYIFTRNVCVNFASGTYIDPKLKTVRAFSIMVAILGGLTTVGLWLAPFCPGHYTPSGWKSLATFYCTILTLFQGLTFLLLDSSICTNNSIFDDSEVLSQYYGDNPQCQWDQGLTCNVVSTVLWFATGLVMCTIVPAPQRPPSEPAETQEVTYQKTTNPDGTTTVSQVAVVKGTAVPATTTAATTGLEGGEKLEEP